MTDTNSNTKGTEGEERVLPTDPQELKKYKTNTFR